MERYLIASYALKQNSKLMTALVASIVSNFLSNEMNAYLFLFLGANSAKSEIILIIAITESKLQTASKSAEVFFFIRVKNIFHALRKKAGHHFWNDNFKEGSLQQLFFFTLFAKATSLTIMSNYENRKY